VFDIGFFELLVIGVVALIVIGPEQLPSTIRTMGLWWGRVKRAIQSTRSELEQQIGADDIRRQLHNEEIMQRLESSKADIEKTFTENIGGITRSLDNEINALLEEEKSEIAAELSSIQTELEEKSDDTTTNNDHIITNNNHTPN
jgi:sec-independent protein translocase protein TatB